MTKLMEWLFAGVLFLGVWLSLLTRNVNLDEKHSLIVLYFPVIAILLFGVYAASVVLWRVYTFNDCQEAALELKEQIEQAKADLKSKGFQFESVKS